MIYIFEFLILVLKIRAKRLWGEIIMNLKDYSADKF